MTCVVYDVESQKGQTSNLSATTHLRDYTINSAEGSELHLNGGNIRRGLVAFILLGCITVFILAGIVIILKYLRNRTSEEYLINWEKKRLLF